MFIKNLLRSGWIHALSIAFIIYPLSAIIQKFVASYTNANLLAYTGVFTLSSACALLLLAGPGELAIKTLKRPETWGYAILQIISYLLFLFSLKYISATEGVALAMMGGFFILLLSFLFLNQKVTKYEVLGGCLMLSGFYIVIDNTPLALDDKAILIVIVVIRALVICGQKMITETHKVNKKAKTFKSEVRVVGFIMAVASFVYLLFLMGIAAVNSKNSITFLKSFPDFVDFCNLELWVIAVILGFIVVSASKYCEFYAGKRIGARYLMSITSLQIIFIYLLEFILSRFGILEVRQLSHNLSIALVLIIVGNIVIAFSGFFKNLKFIKKGKIQDTLKNMEHNFVEEQRDFDIVKLNLKNLLSLYNNDSKKLSQDLDVERILLDNIVNYDLEDIKLHRKVAKKINYFATENVAIKDKLTKAYNRYYLESRFAELLNANKEFKLYLLDLNKFKPVNDTFGHKAGDYALIEVVNRLNTLDAFKDNVFRIGGDEFVLIQTKNLENDFSEEIIKIIEEPIGYEDKSFEISTSIGTVLSKDENSLKELLAVADKKMYKHKNRRER